MRCTWLQYQICARASHTFTVCIRCHKDKRYSSFTMCHWVVSSYKVIRGIWLGSETFRVGVAAGVGRACVTFHLRWMDRDCWRGSLPPWFVFAIKRTFLRGLPGQVFCPAGGLAGYLACAQPDRITNHLPPHGNNSARDKLREREVRACWRLQVFSLLLHARWSSWRRSEKYNAREGINSALKFKGEIFNADIACEWNRAVLVGVCCAMNPENGIQFPAMV